MIRSQDQMIRSQDQGIRSQDQGIRSQDQGIIIRSRNSSYKCSSTLEIILPKSSSFNTFYLANNDGVLKL